MHAAEASPTERIIVETAQGPGRLVIDRAETPVAAIVLAHGAGGGVESADLSTLARDLPALGITVVRHEQPWVVAGRRVAPRPQTLDAAWLETAPAVRELVGDLAIVLGGRSAGARIACRTWAAADARSVVCLAFPLHPPGRPERSRADELLAAPRGTLVVQGDRDPFGRPDEVASAVGAHVRVVPIPDADHALRTGARAARSTEESLQDVVEAVAAHVLAVAP